MTTAAAESLPRSTDMMAPVGAEAADWQAKVDAARRGRADPDPVRAAQEETVREVKREVAEAGGGEVSADEDEDLIMATQSLPHMCPITKMVLENPVTCQSCSHTYSLAAITAHIRNSSRHGGGAPCPVAGCRSRVTMKTIRPDRRVAAHVERYMRLQSAGGSSSAAAAAAESLDLEDDDDDDDGEEDEEGEDEE